MIKKQNYKITGKGNLYFSWRTRSADPLSELKKIELALQSFAGPLKSKITTIGLDSKIESVK